MGRVLLGVNIDHVATVREARRVDYPDPVEAAQLAERGGADGITVHLREDRRHIQDRDVERLRDAVATKLNLEMAATPQMVVKAIAVKPEDVCLVPERRQELTTEGGLDVRGQRDGLRRAVAKLREAAIRVSLFIDPEPAEIDAAREVGAQAIELHTGVYCNARSEAAVEAELRRLRAAASLAHSLGLQVNGGHGLRVDDVAAVAAIPEIVELNIGHSIVARAMLVGMEAAVREMRRTIDRARGAA